MLRTVTAVIAVTLAGRCTRQRQRMTVVSTKPFGECVEPGKAPIAEVVACDALSRCDSVTGPERAVGAQRGVQRTSWTSSNW